MVTLNISRYRSDALILTEDSITTLPLPGLAVNTVISQVNAFHQALHSVAHGDTTRERAAAQRKLSQILAWLWDTAADPALENAGLRGAARPSHKLAPDLVGDGRAQRPAAYPCCRPPRRSRRTRRDRSGRPPSYTPTIGALRHARRPATLADSQQATPPALIVAMPTTQASPIAASSASSQRKSGY